MLHNFHQRFLCEEESDGALTSVTTVGDDNIKSITLVNALLNVTLVDPFSSLVEISISLYSSVCIRSSFFFRPRHRYTELKHYSYGFEMRSIVVSVLRSFIALLCLQQINEINNFSPSIKKDTHNFFVLLTVCVCV